MKILITDINVHNVDNISWCLGFAGLATMNEVLSDTSHQVNVDVKDVKSEEFGDMMLAFYDYGFTIVVTK